MDARSMPLARETHGSETALAIALVEEFQFDRMRIEDLVLCGRGNRVCAERVDHFCRRDGTIVLTVRAVGVFHIRGRKIAHWRDYFDTAGFAAAVGGQAE